MLIDEENEWNKDTGLSEVDTSLLIFVIGIIILFRILTFLLQIFGLFIAFTAE